MLPALPPTPQQLAFRSTLALHTEPSITLCNPPTPNKFVQPLLRSVDLAVTTPSCGSEFHKNPWHQQGASADKLLRKVVWGNTVSGLQLLMCMLNKGPETGGGENPPYHQRGEIKLLKGGRTDLASGLST